MPAAARREDPVQMTTRKRGRGWKTAPLGFRCPVELIEAIEAIGDRTVGATILLDRAVDAEKELGDLWRQVLVRAVEDGCTQGEALGRLARETLEKKGGRR